MAMDLQLLSEREKEALRLLGHGHDAKSAARELGLSVHTVNERLRSARHKLQVTSSKAAVRLLLAHEAPDKLVYKDFGVGLETPLRHARPTESGHDARRRRLALAGGGMAIMSLLILVAMLTLEVPAARPSGEWSLAAAGSAPARVHNAVRLERDRLLWNGAETSEADLRQFLAVVAQMNPQPPIVLSYQAGVSSRRVEQVRRLIGQALRCTPATCVELSAGPQ